MRGKPILLIILLAAASNHLALADGDEKFLLTGKVFDTVGNPVPNVICMVKPGDIQTQTDPSGKFSIHLPRGSYQLILFKEGFSSVQFNLDHPINTSLEFELSPFGENIDVITVTGMRDKKVLGRLNSIEGTLIFEGKKSEVIHMDQLIANKASNNARQTFSRIQGLTIWESDCGGLQLGIGGRGLSPNRSANFNMRQNGYDISADNLGYPESYYSPPMMAIDQIQVVRGAASLQFGSQFGGLVNFKLKQGPTDRPIQLETSQSYGSFGFFNSYNAIGGQIGKLNYYAAYQYRRGNCWRCNSEFNAHNAFLNLNYNLTSKWQIGIEYTFATYLARQPGGLTDKLFLEDPKQSIRKRNWMGINWNILALTSTYKFSPQTTLSFKNFSFLGEKHALGYLERVSRLDPAEFISNPNAPELERDLLSDRFTNNGTELRLLHRYKLFGAYHAFSVGSRYFLGNTWRRQGNASTGENPDFNYLRPDNLEGSDFNFPSRNLAVFGENMFNISDNLSLTPGFRYETISTASDGYYKQRVEDQAGNALLDTNILEDQSNTRSFWLYGLGVSYKWKGMEFYGNYTRNYRGVNFNDIRVVNSSIRVDPKLTDETGFTADLGLRGTALKSILSFDATLFVIHYNNKIGLTSAIDEETNRFFLLRTNIADAIHQGIEFYVEADLAKSFALDSLFTLSVFTNTTVLQASYTNAQETVFEGKKVEYVPELITRTGLTFGYKNWQSSLLYSHTSQQYSDASNAPFQADATFGLIPAYSIWDITTQYKYRQFTGSFTVNNITNEMYFTRRATGYPGPGIIPSDGRNYTITVGARF